nr:hypothetical protein [Candidatus Njordarchaeum guaymaensis]
MPRKAIDEKDSKDSFSRREERKEEDFKLIGSEIEEALKNIGSEEGEDLKVVSEEKGTARKEEVKPVKKQAAPKEEEPLERLVKKVDEVYGFLDDLSKSLVQLNKELKDRVDLITTEMDRFAANLRDASEILERVRSEAQGTPPSMQAGAGGEREPTLTTAQRQQQPPPSQQPQSYPPPPQQGYQPPSYAYQSPPPQQPQYYTSRPPYPPQPPPLPPQSPGFSPEEAVARGIEMLKGTVFADVTASMDQVASIIFSRLLDVREKILRLDPQFPIQEFEPVLSELRANPRMKLSHVDKRKLIDRMVNWANRLPRPP